jgi:hypothetical protein
VDVVRLILEERTCSSGDESKRSECSHDQDREMSRDAEKISISASPSKQKRSSNPAQSKNVPSKRFPPTTALRNKVLANKVKAVKDPFLFIAIYRDPAYQHSSHWVAGSHN